MEKIESKFIFSNEYLDNQSKEQFATVYLDIDYRANKFRITPYCGSTDGKFEFINTSHKWQMWKAILKSIDQAIDFANQELQEQS